MRLFSLFFVPPQIPQYARCVVPGPTSLEKPCLPTASIKNANFPILLLYHPKRPLGTSDASLPGLKRRQCVALRAPALKMGFFCFSFPPPQGSQYLRNVAPRTRTLAMPCAPHQSHPNSHPASGILHPLRVPLSRRLRASALFQLSAG
ncbi:hypothetical protein C8F04DRAFT_427176 [Mycena alexandri]|uniref:Uncharacterized protein n=1 Tax=Mycena alexandri TaxID=1745969 RepID=A0AAD6T342_9AGAR|nr:hypothetical protein C8F04DRAFT_427176 [Mycena alexandri]